MENKIKTFIFSKIKKPQYFVPIIGITLLLIISIISAFIKTSAPISTVPSQVPSTITVNPTSVTSEPLPTPKLTINWKLGQEPTVEKLLSYNLTSPLTSDNLQKNLTLALGFKNTDRAKGQDSYISIWTNSKQSLLINTQDNSLIFSTIAKPPQSGPAFSEDKINIAIHQIISNLFGKDIDSTTISQNITYYKTFNIYSKPSPQETADLVRVSLYQSVNQYPVAALSESGAVFTFYLDRNLKLYSFNINGGFAQINQGKELTVIPFSDIKNSTEIAQRINAAPDLGTNFQTAASKSIDLSATKAQIGYIQIGSSLLPVYLFEGDLTGTTIPSQSGIYILPASKQ